MTLHSGFTSPFLNLGGHQNRPETMRKDAAASSQVDHSPGTGGEAGAQASLVLKTCQVPGMQGRPENHSAEPAKREDD